MDCCVSSRVGLNSSAHGDLCGKLGSWRSDEVGMFLSRSRGVKMSSHRSVCALTVEAKKKVTEEWNYPWPKKVTEDMQKDALKLLCRYQPMKREVQALSFEKPIIDLQDKMVQVRDMANKTGMDFSAQIMELEEKYNQVRQDLYKNLTPAQRLQLARHPQRPNTYDHILAMTDKWIELHGDRAGHDDPAIVSGIGTMEGMSFMFIGHQKGRNTKEHIYRNFGMPQPWGYRKALRMMKHAAHHGLPILTFIDTPGAYAGLEAEETGQGEAIALNLREMFSLDVPMITTVIGEGGSGGALAIGCGNKMLMMENSVYYVASPEACAAILWKSQDATAKAAEALKITPTDLYKLGIADEIIPEPLGGAQYDPATASKNIKKVLLKHMEAMLSMDTKAIMKQRHDKYRQIGEYIEGVEVDPQLKRNMKLRDVPLEERALANGAARVDGIPMNEFVTKRAAAS